MTLLEQITIAEDELMHRQRAVRMQEKILKNLKDLRIDCNHDFLPPYVGYEHEGGNCRLCGINELYNHTLQQNR